MALNLKLEACGLEVTVLGPCGKPLPIFSKREDASSGNRVNHLVAPSGGGEFAVEVKRGDEAKCYSRAIIATLKIDGRQVEVDKVLLHGDKDACHGCFEGFLTETTADGRDVFSAFRFAALDYVPVTQDAKPVTDDMLGHIQVSFYTAVEAGRPAANPHALFERTPGPVSARGPLPLPEDTKFFWAPGLHTVEGPCVPRPSNWSAKEYRQMDLVWQIDLVYDTAERLLLRRVLDPSLREHKELLREQGLTPGAAPPSSSTACASAAAEGARSLLAYLEPLTVDGRKLGQGQYATCDLLDDDMEGGVWQVHDRAEPQEQEVPMGDDAMQQD